MEQWYEHKIVDFSKEIDRFNFIGDDQKREKLVQAFDEYSKLGWELVSCVNSEAIFRRKKS